MATINEDYVSFELANLLKEKGFDVECVGRYSIRSKEFHVDYTRKCHNGGSFECAAPTLQMTMKWLRKVHNIHIVIHPYTDTEGHNWSFIFDKFAYGCWQELGIYITDSWNSYEEACEAAVKYCLVNLI